MTDRKQFEAMLEALINEDQETAKEIFHNIVVGKSREIYEELLKEDFDLAESEEEEEEESSEEEEKGSENPFGGDDAEGDDAEGDDAEGDDAEGEEGSEEEPFGDEESEEEFGGEEGEGDIEDRVMDLEDALEELKAEFEELMSQEAEEPNHDIGAIDAAGDGDAGDDFGGEPEGEEDELHAFMEYVDKVALPKHGDNGVNTKSIVAGKNDMGGTTANIAKGGEMGGKGVQSGLLKPTTKPQTGGNVNVPGAKSATKLKPVTKGHGAEKKGAGESAPNTKSIVGSRK